MRTVAYYKGCLAALSAKELDTSTQALAPKVGLELIELEAVTCCRAGDIHEAEPDYYLHLNARILAYAEETGTDTLMTICNVCTLNLRQANHALQGDASLLARVNENLVTVGAPPYSGGVEVMHFLWLISAGEGYELLQGAAHKGLRGLKIAPFYGCQILRPSEAHRLRGSRQARVARADLSPPAAARRWTTRRDQMLRLPIIRHGGRRAAELIQPIRQAKEAGADAMVTPCPLCHLSLDAWQSKLLKQTGRTSRCRSCTSRGSLGRRRDRQLGAEVQAARRLGRAGDREALRLIWPSLGSSPQPRRSLRAGVVRGRLAPSPDRRGRGWPGAPPGSTAAHRASSDLHLGVPSRGGAVQDAVDWVLERKPGLVCITGDLVSRRSGCPSSNACSERRPLLRRARQPTSRTAAIPSRSASTRRRSRRLPGVVLRRRRGGRRELRGRRVQVVGVEPRSYAARAASPERLAERGERTQPPPLPLRGSCVASRMSSTCPPLSTCTRVRSSCRTRAEAPSCTPTRGTSRASRLRRHEAPSRRASARPSFPSGSSRPEVTELVVRST